MAGEWKVLDVNKHWATLGIIGGSRAAFDRAKRVLIYFKVRLCVLMRDQTLTHLCVDISLIP